MAFRSLRRVSPITLLLAVIMIFGFALFILSPDKSEVSSSISGTRKTPPSTKYRKPGGVMRFNMNKLNATTDPIGNREKVLILTPMARFYDDYWKNLLRLSFPRELVELGFILPKGREGTAALTKLQDAVHKVQIGNKKHRFAGVNILRQDFDSPVSQNEKERHAMSAQKARRAAMSRARNSLLFTNLRPDVSWVLWLDADIIETPPTLVQDLAMHNKDIIIPNCFQKYKDKGQWKERPYDFNSWQDSENALKLAKSMGKDDILLEGYAEMATYRTLMAYQRQEDGNKHAEMDLDGVGGTALLVKADVHRDGAMFPPFSFYHLIETEGFAKMARRLGYKPVGLPNYLVYHYNE